MFSAAEEFVIYQIMNGTIREYPYPHLFITPIFPHDFYADLRRCWPSDESFRTLSSLGRAKVGTYDDRRVIPIEVGVADKFLQDHQVFWREFVGWLMGKRLMATLLTKFAPYVDSLLEERHERLALDGLIVRDGSNYGIGPHMDHLGRIMSLLFYCPDSIEMSHLGTTIYTPEKPDLTYKKGVHYSCYNEFNKIATMPYIPNSLFAFVNTDNAFHGVEKIKDKGVVRDLILYDIQKLPQENEREETHTSQQSFVEIALSRLMRF